MGMLFLWGRRGISRPREAVLEYVYGLFEYDEILPGTDR
jgi:hypothetical protein